DVGVASVAYAAVQNGVTIASGTKTYSPATNANTATNFSFTAFTVPVGLSAATPVVITASATDTLGQITFSSASNLTIDPPPTSSVAQTTYSILEGQTLSFTVNASDNAGPPALTEALAAGSPSDPYGTTSFTDNHNGTGSFTFTPSYASSALHGSTTYSF